ncbi:MAG: 16S rRNA (guanine966-N2)-methyltransferase [Candidatus Pseudothioglobus sp.]|jgi:16S rRNA (guanine966-N2)-methyltransferase
MSEQAQNRHVRIIGGKWRSRKVSFADYAQIRPSPSRIRETLFNWLQYHVKDSRCLELYAGSGILSLEALSRGAEHVTLIEYSRKVCSHLKQQFENLTKDPQRFDCLNLQAENYLRNRAPDALFDLVFLDPPFSSDELSRVLPMVGPCLTADGLIYIETDAQLDPKTLPDGWEVDRQKKAGSVHYCLCRRTQSSQ